MHLSPQTTDFPTACALIAARSSIPFRDQTILQRALKVGILSKDAYRIRLLGFKMFRLCIAESLYAKYPNLPPRAMTLALERYRNNAIPKLAPMLGLDVMYRDHYLPCTPSSENLDEVLASEFSSMIPPQDSSTSSSEDLTKAAEMAAREVVLQLTESEAYITLFMGFLGAAYLDSGLLAAQQLLTRLVLSQTIDVRDALLSRMPKKQLVKLCVDFDLPSPSYRLLTEEGRSTANSKYTSGVFLGDRVIGTGTAPSIAESEREAAQDAIFAFYKKHSPVLTPIEEEAKRVHAAKMAAKQN